MDGAIKSNAGPSQEQIEQWKAVHGEVYASVFGEEEIFVWRPLLRPEWIEIQQKLADPARTEGVPAEEMVLDTVLLWPSSVDWAQQKAGTVSTLHEQVAQNSNFVNPQAAGFLVLKL